MHPSAQRNGLLFAKYLAIFVTQFFAVDAVAGRVDYLVSGVVTRIDNAGQALGEDLPFQIGSIVRGSLKFDSSIADTDSSSSRGRYPTAITDFALIVGEYSIFMESSDVFVSNVPSCFVGGGDRTCDSFGFSSFPPVVSGVPIGGKVPTSAGVSAINAGDSFLSDRLPHVWPRAIQRSLPLAVYFESSTSANPVAVRTSILITAVPEPVTSLLVLFGLFVPALTPVRIVR